MKNRVLLALSALANQVDLICGLLTVENHCFMDVWKLDD